MKNFTSNLKMLLVAVAALFGLSAHAADYTFSVTCDPSYGDYVIDQTYFDGTEIATKLGLADTTALKELINTGTAFYLQLPDGTRTNENFSDPNQPWMNAAGEISAYGEDATCWFAGIAWDTDDNGVPGVNAWIGQFPGYFKTVYEESNISATFYLVNGDKEVSFEFKLHVDAAEKLEKYLSELTIVKEMTGTLNFTEGGQYEGKTLEIDLTEACEALGTDTATYATDFANHVLTQSIYFDSESQESQLTDTLNLPSTLSSGAWFGRIRDYESEDPDAYIAQNGPMAWGSGCTYYLQDPTLADGKFTLTYGQYPGTLNPGDVDYADLYLVNGTNAVKLTVKVNVEPQPDAPFSEWEEVGVVEISVDQYPTTDYSTSTFAIDVDAAAELLGVGSTEVTLLPLKDANNLYTASGTANNGGWWFNKEGYVCSWGAGEDGSYFFIEPAESGVYSAMHIGQYPSDYEVGDSAVTNLYLCAGTKYVRYHVVMHIIQETQPEWQDWKFVGTKSITITQKASRGDYVWSSATDAGCAEITDQEIQGWLGCAYNSASLVFYAQATDAVTEETGCPYSKSYTCTPYPGFWCDADGKNIGWGSSVWGLTIGNTTLSDGIALEMMQMGGNEAGTVFHGPFYLVNVDAGKVLTLNLTFRLVTDEEAETAGGVGEEVGSCDLMVAISPDEFEAEFPLDSIAEALGMTTDELNDGYTLCGLDQYGTYTSGVQPQTGLMFDENGYTVSDGEFGLNFESGSVISWSNQDMAEDWCVTTKICFNNNGKQYTVNLTLCSPQVYTGVKSIETAKSTSIYDLAGRRVNKAQRGVYIQDGKKILK